MVNARERLVFHVQELERLEELKQLAAADVKEGFDKAKAEGFDAKTLKVVLKLRKMTPNQRRERRALEAIYMAALGMLDGDSLPDEARRRLDDAADERRQGEPSSRSEAPGRESADQEPPAGDDAPRQAEQPPLIVKDPEEARAEGAAAALAGKRIYDNPYRAGDPCRAAWDEGWCAQHKSHGMETPRAYQRRSDKPPAPHDPADKRDREEGDGAGERGAA